MGMTDKRMTPVPPTARLRHWPPLWRCVYDVDVSGVSPLSVALRLGLGIAARIAAPPQTVAQKSSVDVARRRDRAAADRAYRGLVDVRALDAGLGGEVRRELGEQIGVTLLRRDLAAIRVGEADGRVGI